MDSKTRFLQDLLKRSSDEHSAGLRAKYAPPPPAPVAAPAPAAVDPLADADPSLLDQLMKFIKPAPPAKAEPSPQQVKDAAQDRALYERDPAEYNRRNTIKRMGEEAWDEEM